LLNDFTVETAPVLEFISSKSLQISKFCPGLNLEHILRYDYQHRSMWLYFLRDVLEKFRERGFLWGDLAPRNIIIDTILKKLYILDFERKLFILDKTVSKGLFGKSFREHAFEEFSAFMYYREQVQLFFDYVYAPYKYEFTVNDISSRRQMALLQYYYGAKNIYSSQEMRYVQDLMAFIARPYKGYPIYMINELTKKGGIYEYIRIVRKKTGSF
jgi:serine/threonine protein kinase